MAEPKVWVFFYGSFINRQVLARGGFVPEQIEVARHNCRVPTRVDADAAGGIDSHPGPVAPLPPNGIGAMKRLFLIGLVAALLAGGCVTHEHTSDPTVRMQSLAPADQPCPAQLCPAPPPIASVPPTAPAPKNEATEELVKLLNETESIDTFLVALEALAALDPNYTRAVPLAIKNAERLELLDGITGADKKTKEQQSFTALVKVFVDAKKAPPAPPTPTLTPSVPTVIPASRPSGPPSPAAPTFVPSAYPTYAPPPSLAPPPYGPPPGVVPPPPPPPHTPAAY